MQFAYFRICIPIVDGSSRCLSLGVRTILGCGILLTLSDAKRQERWHNGKANNALIIMIRVL